MMPKDKMIEAVIRDSPLHFKISHEFANDCLRAIGSVVRHQVLGPIFCDEAVIADDGSVAKMIFIGTSNKNDLRR
jgi:hypothetical protein